MGRHKQQTEEEVGMVGRWRVGADPSVSSKKRMGSTEMHCTAPNSSRPRDGMLTAGPSWEMHQQEGTACSLGSRALGEVGHGDDCMFLLGNKLTFREFAQKQNFVRQHWPGFIQRAPLPYSQSIWFWLQLRSGLCCAPFGRSENTEEVVLK